MTTKLTDSGTQRAIEDAAERVAERVLNRSNTPVVSPRASDSQASMYRIAEEVENRSEANRWVRCEERGPAFKIGKRMDAFEKAMESFDAIQGRHESFINQYLGEQKFKRFVMPVLIGFFGSAAGVGLMALILRGVVAGLVKAP